MRCAALLAAAGTAGAVVVSRPGVMHPLGNNVCVTDCCTNCIMSPHTYHFDPYSEPGFDYTVTGQLTQPLTAPAYTAHGKLMGVKVAEKPNTGSACEPAQIQIEGGSLATFTVDFTNGGAQSCPYPAGPITVPGHVAVTINPPVGAFKQYFQTNDASGAMVICLEIDVGPACKTPQPPPAPIPPPPTPPAGPLYKCSSAQQCVEATTGVDLTTCHAMCRPAPGPVPPAPTPPAPTPPAPAVKYACVNAQCVVDSSGLDLKICQAACS